MSLELDILEFSDALRDSKLASMAMFKLCKELVGMNCKVEIDLNPAILAQREVEAAFYTIENFLKAAQEYRRTHQ